MAEELTADEVLVRARARERLLDQAHEGALRLEADGRDPIGRGLLGEAVQGLDPLPAWVAEARDRLLVPRLPPTPIRTARLVLRPFEEPDAEALHRIYGREDVSALLLGPPVPRDEAVAEIRRRRRLCFPDQGPPEACWLAAEHEGRVVAQLDTRNRRSAALCERLGMRREVDARQNYWSKGEWTDSLHYALLAQERGVSED